jgi:nitroimidazol reductase NimA-like FMN-containing flavoprotein (pyridoxamine 5'-phosphate oxidase superfamily)
MHGEKEPGETRTRLKTFLGILIAAGMCVASIAQGAEGAEGLNGAMQTALQAESYIYVATRRLNGEWSTSAPVWFMYDGEAIYFTIAPSSHKAHRIHRGSPVRIWIGKKDGPVFEGTARFIRGNPSLVNRMAEVYKQKYWLAWLGFFRPRPRRVGSGKTLVVKVTPIAPQP